MMRVEVEIRLRPEVEAAIEAVPARLDRIAKALEQDRAPAAVITWAIGPVREQPATPNTLTDVRRA